jgi:hypothetical protein
MRHVVQKLAAVLALAVLIVPLGSIYAEAEAIPLGPPPCCVNAAS